MSIGTALTLVTLLAALAAVVWIHRVARSRKTARRLQEEGELASGRIIDLDCIYDRQQDPTRYLFRYVFRAERGGREVLFTGVAEDLPGDAMLVGKPARIRYLPDDPAISKLEAVDEVAACEVENRSDEPVPLDVPNAEELAVIEAESRTQLRRIAGRHMVFGAGMVIAGLGASGYTYALAQEGGGGTYSLFWGLILAGGLEFVHGASKLFFPRSI